MPRPPLQVERYDPAKSQMIARTALVLFTLNSQERIEVYDIQNGRLVSPRLVNDKDINALAEVVRNQLKATASFRGRIGKNTLYLAPQLMAFFWPAHVATLLVEQPGKPERKLKVYLPDSVGVYQGPDHGFRWLWCKDGVRPEAGKNVLVPAVLPNLDGGGVLCLGSVFKNVRFNADPVQMEELLKKTLLNGTFTEWRSSLTGPIVKHMQNTAQLLDPKEQKNYFWKTRHTQLIEHLKQCPPKPLEHWIDRSI